MQLALKSGAFDKIKCSLLYCPLKEKKLSYGNLNILS